VGGDDCQADETSDISSRRERTAISRARGPLSGVRVLGVARIQMYLCVTETIRSTLRSIKTPAGRRKNSTPRS